MNLTVNGMRLIDLMSHACTSKLVAAISELADEATIKAALEQFPNIVGIIIEDAAAEIVSRQELMIEKE